MQEIGDFFRKSNYPGNLFDFAKVGKPNKTIPISAKEGEFKSMLKSVPIISKFAKRILY